MYRDNQQVININIDDILPNRFQPRLKFSEEEISNLAESIREHGVIQPIVVRKLGDRYELIAGERRTKASKAAGMKTIPAIIVDLSDTESAEVALIENIQRQDLTSIEEAVSYRKILDMGYLNQSQLADKVGKKQSTIANKLRLLTLPKKIQSALLESKISERHARSLLRLENEEKQISMLDRIISERLTVRKTDQEIDKVINLNKMEVLEIPNLEDFRVKEDENMDNNFNFNDIEIPTTNIIEENNNNDFTSINEVASQITPIENLQNPGFMDIDRIADQAQDIKNNNIEFGVSPEQIIPTIPEEQQATELRPNRFFNVFDNEEETPEEQGQQKTETPFDSINNMDIFNIKPAVPISEEVSKTVESNIASSLELNEVENLSNNIQLENINDSKEIIEPIINIEKSLIETETIPVIEENNNSQIVNTINDSMQSIEPVINIEEKPTMVETGSIKNEYTPISEFNNNAPSDLIFHQDPNAQNNDIDDIAIIDDNQFGSDEQILPILESEPEVIKPPLKDVISKIRELSNTIEGMNYAVELEEMDLEEIYQIIIKIHK